MRFFTLGLMLAFSFVLSAQSNTMVEVRSNVYDPAEVTISVGDTVTWTNVQGVHNVNALQSVFPDNPEGFRNGNAAGPGWTYSYVFTLPGTYDYQCDPHVTLGMVGKVIVEEANVNNNVVITEINYNGAEGGADSTEFIELYNIGPGDVDMTGWSFSEGVTFTFPDYTLAENTYVIIAVNDTAVSNLYSYSGDLFEWTSGALSNGGENIVLVDGNDNVIDEVRYDDVLPWPEAPDGDGPSLVLCDFASDNALGQNWQAASTSTGTFVNGNEVFGNPGGASECGAAAPILYWLDDFEVLDEDDGTISVGVVLQNFTSVAPTINISMDTSSRATMTDDFTTSPSLPISETGEVTALDTFFFTLTIIDDAEIEEEEDIVLSLSGNGEVADSLATFRILDNDSEVVITPIDDINDVDQNGDAISDGQDVTLRGVVHCIDFRGSAGLQFWIIETATGDGINVFNFNDVDDYVVTEGDELTIAGTIDQFNGLLEIIPNSITVESSGNDLVAATEVTALSEETENKYITLISDGLIEGEGAIARAGGGYNVSVLAGMDTFTLRVEDEINVDSAFIANYFSTADVTFSITGIGSQFDNNDPRTGGYQLLPCGEGSFGFVVNVSEPEWAEGVSLFPNPTVNELNVRLPIAIDQYRLVDMQGRQVIGGAGMESTNLRLDLSQLPSGVYFLQLINADQLVSRPVMRQ